MGEHYYSEKQTSTFRPKKIEVALLGKEFEVYTSGGVFSPKKIDKGTKLLIENAEVEKGTRLLDLGCGYGIVGLAVKLANPEVEVVFTDVNQRAVKLTRMNLELNKVKGKVKQGKGFEKLKGEMFDVILLNPPQTAGKKTCFKMIEESKEHLKKKGTLQLVARHQKGGKTLKKKMEEVFGNAEETAKKGGYRVYVSRKKE